MKKTYRWTNHLLNFLAVILGVYLAFFINEKAKSAAEKKEVVLLMNSMINDLSADIKTYEDYHIPVNNKCRKEVDSLLTLLIANDMERINNQLPKIFQVENYVPNTSTYNSIKSSGKIRLFEDLALQKKLSDYYDGLVIECESKNKIQVDYFMNEVVSWLTNNADLMEVKLLEDAPLIVFRNKLMMYQSLISQKVNNYEKIVEESKALEEKLQSLANKK